MMWDYSKKEIIFAAGWIGVWILANLFLFHWRTDSVGFWILTAWVAVLDTSFILWPVGFRRLFTGWAKLTHWLGRLNSYLILTLIFFLIITPIGLVLRLLKRDLLERTFTPEAPGYWKSRTERPTQQENYRRIF